MVFQYNVPVVVFMEAKNWIITDDSISAEIDGYKIRDCTFINGSEVGYIINENKITETKFRFLETDNKIGDSKPTSKLYKISFNRWEWEKNYYGNNKNVQVMITVKHSCNLNDTFIQSTIGPFDVPIQIKSS